MTDPIRPATDTCIGCKWRKPVYVAVSTLDDDGDVIETCYTTNEVEGYHCANPSSPEHGTYVDGGGPGCNAREPLT